MNEEMNFTVVTENGEEVICDVISLYQDEKNDELFVLYTDYSFDSNQKFKVYLSQLIETEGAFRLKLVKDKVRYDELVNTAKTLYGQPLRTVA